MTQVKVNNFDIEVTQVSQRLVAIVKFGPAGFTGDGMKAGEYYQVTVDPRKISPSGAFIRFGDYPGDEVVGWQRCQAMSIVEILGDWPYEEDRPMLNYGTAPFVPLMLPMKAE